MKRKVLFLILLFVFCSVLVSGQEKFSAKVKLYVQADSKSTQDSMYSYISRELRSLNDVVIVSDGEDYGIDVVMIDVVIGARTVGYAISINYKQPAKCTYKEKFYDGTPIIAECESLLWNSVMSSSLDSLKTQGENIVIKFDTKILESARKIFKQESDFKKLLNDIKKDIKP